MSPSSLSSVSSSTVAILSKCTVYPDERSTMGDLRLSVSDLPMLSCHYIQKGIFLPRPSKNILPLIKHSLSRALSLFPPLAGRLSTHPDGSIHISCNDAGVDFVHASAPSLALPSLLPRSSDVPWSIKSLFTLDGTISFHGHFLPLAAFQLTKLGDGSVFLGCTVNHAVVDGTSFWNFLNCWAEICRLDGGDDYPLSRPPDFRRNFFGGSDAVIRFPSGSGPEVTFSVGAPLRERILRFSREAILELKSKANQNQKKLAGEAISEMYGKQLHDRKYYDEISSFQSLCGQLWRSVTRARSHLHPDANTTFRMAVNCRHRVVPRIETYYFGNAIQSIPTTATVGEVVSSELNWTAGLLHGSVVAHGDKKIKKGVAEWEAEPRCFPLGNPGGAGITMGSSPRFPMYDGNDFGWGGPVAVRSGKANKFDGKISAFPTREGDGSVDLEVCLAPETMAALLEDQEFMHYVSSE